MMAFKVLNYNLNGRVGQHCPNMDTDVLLVRFLLRRASQTARFSGPYSMLKLVPIFDDEMKKAILWFQGEVKKAGRPVTVDGVVSHAPDGDGYYTINYLYGTYAKYYPQFKGDLALDPECPKALQGLNQISGYDPAQSGRVH